MKNYKKLLVSIISVLAFILTATCLSNSHVEAASNRAKIRATLGRPRKVVVTKNTKIYKENVVFPLAYAGIVAGPKTLKKGTTIKVMGGGMKYHWFIFKKGYTHSGLTKNYDLRAGGYVWVALPYFTDASWFKLK